MSLDEKTARQFGFPTPPKPVPGCGVCARLDQARATAERAGDHSAVSDCNVKMRGHEHQGTA